jgi:hypothetical protein
MHNNFMTELNHGIVNNMKTLATMAILYAVYYFIVFEKLSFAVLFYNLKEQYKIILKHLEKL